MSIESIVASGRRLLGVTLLDRVRISDRTFVSDTTGGKTETYVERTRTEAARFVAPKDDDPVLQLDSVYGPTEMLLLLPLTAVFKEGDRIRNLKDDIMWQITRDVTVPSEMQVVKRCGIREVDR